MSEIIFRYRKWLEKVDSRSGSSFDKLFELFMQLLHFSAGDVAEALNWLTQLDEMHDLTDGEMGIGDFIEELRKRGFLEEDANHLLKLSARSERTLRQRSLHEIFSDLRKGGKGGHPTPHLGAGNERLPEVRPWRFGDDLSKIDVTATLSNSFRRSGGSAWNLREDDFQVAESNHVTNTSTVVMIDLSHSMVLYGEDRITPARKTAMALAELITTQYKKDTLDIVAFGNDAWEVSIKDLPYLSAGPFYTNTRAGLQRARDILRRRKNRNKQIFLITDGKPSCHFEYGKMYRNAFGLDRKIVNKVLDEAVVCRREGITITTFMIARDPYLQKFVRTLTKANHGRAYYSSLDDLGSFLFEDYINNRRRSVR